MTRSLLALFALASTVALLRAPCLAGVPFPPNSSCTITITQFFTRTACISLFQPDVIRLTPQGSSAVPAGDRARVDLLLRDASGTPCAGAFVTFCETSGIVNIANGGATTALSNSEGRATVFLDGGSGYGLVAITADGVALCSLEVRTPDVARGSLPSMCDLPTSAASYVNFADVLNPVCGVLANFGTVTPGINNGWDLSCDNNVNGVDAINCGIGKCFSFLMMFGDGGVLGARNDCSTP